MEYARSCVKKLIKKLNDKILVVIYRKTNNSIMVIATFKSTKLVSIYDGSLLRTLQACRDLSPGFSGSGGRNPYRFVA